MFDKCIQETHEGVVLTVYVQPRAAKTEYVGLYGETALKIRVSAPPVDGAANEALCQFLSKYLGLPKKAVVIISGPGSRQKRVFLKGESGKCVKQKLHYLDETNLRPKMREGGLKRRRDGGFSSNMIGRKGE